MSAWSGERYTAMLPGRLPDWRTSRDDWLNTRSVGMSPSASHPVERMSAPRARRLCMWMPMPPASRLICAHSFSES